MRKLDPIEKLVEIYVRNGLKANFEAPPSFWVTRITLLLFFLFIRILFENSKLHFMGDRITQPVRGPGSLPASPRNGKLEKITQPRWKLYHALSRASFAVLLRGFFRLKFPPSDSAVPDNTGRSYFFLFAPET